MSFDIEIIEEKKNPLIDRMEIKFKLDHFGTGTPNRLEVKKKIAAMKNANEKLIIIRKLQTHYGNAYDIGIANIYENSKELQYFEPFHIKVRNLEKEKQDEIYKLKKRKESFKHLFEYD
jgi:small subunit ribosomal protein S24e